MTVQARRTYLEMASLASALFCDLPELPPPGGGRTSERFSGLWEMAAQSPSVGRLLEAHFDAIAILTEHGTSAPASFRFGVWAAGGPIPLTLAPEGARWRLSGEKQWCSGASLVSHALVTVGTGDRTLLVLVDLGEPGVELCRPSWVSPALADVDTRTVVFDVLIDEQQIIGGPGWYLHRPGFWHGAIGVAACWAGGAAGLVDRVRQRWPSDAHALAHLGAIDAQLWMMRAVLDHAAQEIDANPGDGAAALRRSLCARHVIDVAAGDITTRLARAVGPGPLAHQPDLHLVSAEVDLYRRQCHAERDLEQLGRLDRCDSSAANSPRV